MFRLIEKTIGVLRANILLLCNQRNVKYKGIKHFVGRMGEIRTEDNGVIKIESSLYLSDRCRIGAYKNGELSIGNNNFFNTNCTIVCYKKVVIGDNNLFGPNIVIVDHNHKHDIPNTLICKQGYDCKQVIIGSDCWICANVVICPGVRIGDHIIIAANSVVNSDALVPGVYAGSPAKLVKNREIEE